ncbi:hypothetical protein MNBD_ALPHA09-1117 [hydrothermal vent metagenome]|uniref:Methyltransferase domain-containing protein n=1 Tax=hydrothermal vent metagenome TaxID=652676 RepID=A0A3B0THT9_9ZZZZ
MTNMDMGAAMTLLYGGIDRQGPGDDTFTINLLKRLPLLPPNPSIADLGCGTGAGSLLLARFFDANVLCVDLLQGFLSTLEEKAKAAGLGHLVKPLKADMGALGLPEGSLDLLWSEGAAYNLTFKGALERWRPLLAEGGIATISEMNWFGNERPADGGRYWTNVYPTIASEAENQERSKGLGFDVLFTERLPAQAWWQNYYDPLLAHADKLEAEAPPALAEAIREARQETDEFRRSSDFVGYTFYVLKAV